MTTANVSDSSKRSVSAPQLGSGWLLWRRQVSALVTISLRKALTGRSSLAYYAVAALPVLMMLVLVVIKRPGGDPIFGTLGDARRAYGMVFQTVILRGLIFFGCVGIFTTLFRGEVLSGVFTISYCLRCDATSWWWESTWLDFRSQRFCFAPA